MNDTSSFFIEEKALFGSYPTQEIVDDFIEKGVEIIVLSVDGNRIVVRELKK